MYHAFYKCRKVPSDGWVIVKYVTSVAKVLPTYVVMGRWLCVYRWSIPYIWLCAFRSQRKCWNREFAICWTVVAAFVCAYIFLVIASHGNLIRLLERISDGTKMHSWHKNFLTEIWHISALTFIWGIRDSNNTYVSSV